MGDADLTGAVIDGRYKVIEAIAEGAMGSVYRGERLQLGRAVAIKIMHQELPDELASRQRFEREAKLMALLEHPNCVSVIDFGVHDEKPFLVMELVRGTSLLEVLEKQRVLEVPRAADIIRQVLSGLSHAHELGIVHRDIKPANIMISEKAGFGTQVRILDFGLARLQENSTKLTTGIVVGTPNYMAPEQCKGSDIDARTDVYACGVMLFELLTGRKPFVADDPIAVVRKHLFDAPPTLNDVEPRTDFGELEAVVAKALAKAPADRFSSAAEMSHAVEAAAAKHTKTSAAALFARAVPESTAPPNSPQATMSGWNVPADARSTAIPSANVPGIPSAPSAGPSSGPTSGVANVGDASAPFTGVATVNEASGALGPTAAGGYAPPSGPLPVPPASQLPPLPQAAPYVPPAGVGAPPGGYQVGAATAAAASTAAAAEAAAAALGVSMSAPPPVAMPPSASPIAMPPSAPPIAMPPSAPPIAMPPSAPPIAMPPTAMPPTEAASAPHPIAGPASGPIMDAPSASVASAPHAIAGSASDAPSAPVASAPVASATAPAASAPGSGGTPNAALEVPPTRPATLPPVRPAAAGDRPIPQLPLTRSQLLIAGGGLLGVIILIAVMAGGGNDKKPGKKATAGAGTAEIEMPEETAGGAAAKIERGKELIASEDYDDAAEMLTTARKRYPDNAELAFLAGKAYFGRLWWGDGVDNFRDAIELDASYKENPELLKAVLKGFLTTPDLDDRIVGFMRHDLGAAMRPYLEETAEKHPKKNLRARARAELNAGR